MYKKLTLLVVFISIILLSGCAKYEEMVKRKMLDKNYEIHQVGINSPVVYILQGTGGINSRERYWQKWFESYGVSTVLINSARMRGKINFKGTPGELDFSKDILQLREILIKEYPEIDVNRFALIGFSRGGTNVLLAGKHFDKQIHADLVFSFYPGTKGWCKSYHLDKPQTDVSIFYGDLDQWGLHSGLQEACQEEAAKKKNVTYYGFENSHHGYDGSYSGSFKAYKKYMRIEPNEKARLETEKIIVDKMKEKWGINSKISSL